MWGDGVNCHEMPQAGYHIDSPSFFISLNISQSEFILFKYGMCVDEECTDFKCKDGFTRAGAGCIDNDECNPSHPCDFDAECINLIGGHTCRCKEGFSGDGLHCKPTPCGPGEYGTGGDDCHLLPAHADDDGKGGYRCHPAMVSEFQLFI